MQSLLKLFKISQKRIRTNLLLLVVNQDPEKQKTLNLQ